MIVTFSMYQIVSDTLMVYYNQKQIFSKKTQEIQLLKDINQLIVLFQTKIIHHTSYIDKKDSYKSILLKDSNQLKKRILQIKKESALQKNLNQTFDSIINHLDNIKFENKNLTYDNIHFEYKLMTQKLILLFNMHAQRVPLKEQVTPELIEISLQQIQFITHNIVEFENHTLKRNYTKNHLEKFITEQMIQTNLKLKKFNIPPALLTKIDNNIENLIYYDFNQTNIDVYNQLRIQLIEAYSNINTLLFEQINQHCIQIQKDEYWSFFLKLTIEIMALLVTSFLLYYFYQSMFIYIRKIQNAHKVKSIFLSNMSHELRTPLNAIIGFLHILKESNDEKEKEKFIDIIYKSSKQLLYIINDILDFSKIEDSKLKIENKPCEIRKELELIIELFSANAVSKNITLKTKFNEDIPLCIISDKFRIKQIVSNLLSNAIKFTPEGGVVTLILESKKKKLLVCVEDNGIGIDKKSQKTIFKSFLQAKESTSREYGGTGLGLSISSKLVSLLGSKLKVESQEDQGSRFFFYLPIKECEEIHQQENADDAIMTYNGSVLLAEDNPTNQFLMQITFSNLKLDVTIANNGQEAITKFKNGNFDIIFMDDNMPNKNGIEATQEIIQHEQQNNLKHTPIVALTANTSSNIKKKFFKAGMDEYMPKPFDIKLLHQILQKYLT